MLTSNELQQINNLESAEKLAQQLDDHDQLAAFRNQFHLPTDDNNQPKIYFCGNSLGLQPIATQKALEQDLEDWKKLGVDGHFQAQHPWMPAHEFVQQNMATLVGAKPIETIAMNSLTVNLHLMMVSFYRPTNQRYKILIEKHAFPSDRYAVESQIRFHGFDPSDALIELAPCDGKDYLNTSDIVDYIKEHGQQIALVMMSGVQYYSGQFFELGKITEISLQQGCKVGFDLAHAAGNLPLELHNIECDFAAWCSYKYLNSGPGSIAGCFVHEKHAKNFELPRFAGWWGHDKQTRFLMEPAFTPMSGAEGWQLSNPPIFALTPLRVSLELFANATMQKLRAKSIQLTQFLEQLIHTHLSNYIKIITPLTANDRGCQLSLIVANTPIDGKVIFKQLEQANIVCDWREPDVIRIAPVPLYNQFTETVLFVKELKKILIET